MRLAYRADLNCGNLLVVNTDATTIARNQGGYEGCGYSPRSSIFDGTNFRQTSVPVHYCQEVREAVVRWKRVNQVEMNLCKFATFRWTSLWGISLCLVIVS